MNLSEVATGDSLTPVMLYRYQICRGIGWHACWILISGLTRQLSPGFWPHIALCDKLKSEEIRRVPAADEQKARALVLQPLSSFDAYA